MPQPTKKTTVLRTIEGRELQRELRVLSDSIDQEARTVELAASSEYPVPRWFGREILDHSPGAIRMGRLKNGAPLLDSHSLREQIGVVEEVWLDDDRRLRARVRFSRSAKAEELWQDVLDGIRRHISIGYIIHEMVLESSGDQGDTYRVMDWEPYEISLISVPADPTVGVGRSIDIGNITIRGAEMPDKDKQTQTAGSQQTETRGAETGAQNPAPAASGANENDILSRERTRISEITAIGQQFSQRSLAQEAIQKGHTVDQFRALVLERMNPGQPGNFEKPGAGDLPGKPAIHSARDLGIQHKELQQYSLMRAINAAATGDWSKAGFEREVSLAIADASGKEARGFYMPHEVLVQRQLEKKTAGKGGELVATELLSEEFIDILRNKAIIGQMGARMLPGLVGDVDIPKKTSGANFYWIGEDEDVQDSDFDFTTLSFSPKTIAGAVPVTRKLRKQSSIHVENLIREDLIEGIGVALDLAMLTGTGLANDPVGLLNMTGVPALTYPAGGVDWASVVDMETKISTFNADAGRLAYLTSVTQRGAAKKAQVFDNTGERIWQNNEVNGYRAEASNQIPADTWIFGDWSQIVIAMWGVLDLKVDPYTKAASDGLVLRVFQDVDAGVRRKEAFCIAKKGA
ncbi:TPA: phage major capsid protein [Vibrio parahaemolyticus]|nr:phage major capsid protein [Vibrio parahaemolyticus]